MSAIWPFAGADPLLGDPHYPRLKEHLVGATGLAYYIDKDAELARRVGRRVAATGARDCASYLQTLLDPARGPAELDALIAEITIGETYFFRHQEHFDALRNLVIPDLIERNRTKRSLRIWCAGCADGPEPYSLAILIQREMAQPLHDWDVTILGTDLNRSSLARARAGKFEEWAFRGMSESLKQQCFTHEGKSWSIAPAYKERVSFQYHNLVENPFPSLLNNLFSFDLIVCRNVMIYFGGEAMRKMIGQFHDCLVPGGWLLVGPTEPNMSYFTAFRTVNAPGVTLYQKANQPAPIVLPELPPLPPLPVAIAPPACLHLTFDDARRSADRGDWEAAAQSCEQLLQKDNLNPRLHLFRALVLEQQRKHDEAERSLRRAIYLDRRSVLAHYYLGLFLQTRGDPRQAARSFENALDLLRGHDPAAIFADADGITAAELKKLTEMHLAILREQV